MASPPPVAFYISSHGFGHASRDSAIINALLAGVPDLPVVVCTQVPAWFLDSSIARPYERRECACDTGFQQLDSLRSDPEASLRLAAEFHERLDEAARREAAFLRQRGIGLVLGDIPPLAFAAAAEAGLPSVAIGNFTWDWIYEGFPEHASRYPRLVPTIQHAYARATAALRLPLHGGFAGLEPVVRDLPLVARRSRHTRAHVRGRLGLPGGPVVLLSFGGYGLPGFDPHALARLPRFTFVCSEPEGGADAGRPAPAAGVRSRSNVIHIEPARLRRAGLGYEDLVRAADVVATKPGYGIVSECMANETAMLYTSRGRFPEYDVLVAAMPRYVRSCFIAQDALLAGDWQPGLDRLLAEPAPTERLRTDGAAVAAELILETLAAA